MRSLKTVPLVARVAIGTFILVGLVAPFLAPAGPATQDLASALQGPSAQHWLGTDEIGRDELSRILYGARTSLTAVGIVLISSLIVGMLIGAIAGARGGLVDEVLMRIIDVGLATPALIIALAIIGLLGPSYWNMVLALTLAYLPSFARITRTLIMAAKRRPYIEAVQLMGASQWFILSRHLLPAALGTVLVYATADAGFIALSIATLSFLGLGIQPPTAEWGQMVVSGLPYMETNAYLVIFPGLALTAVVVMFNVLGEAVATDKIPRVLRRRALRQRRSSVEAALAGRERILTPSLHDVREAKI